MKPMFSKFLVSKIYNKQLFSDNIYHLSTSYFYAEIWQNRKMGDCLGVVKEY